MHINVKKWNFFLTLYLRDLRLSSAIEVGVNLAVLNELVLCDHLFKLRALDKVVVNAIFFTRAGFPSRIGHTEAESTGVVLLSQTLDQSSLSNARRSRNDERTVDLCSLEGLESCPVPLHLELYAGHCRLHSPEAVLLCDDFTQITDLLL